MPRYFPILVISILFSSLFLVVRDSIGSIEGKFFPVVSPIVLFNPEAVPPPFYKTKWNGFATKLRDCQYVGLHWYLGERAGRKVSVIAKFTDPPEVRGQGVLNWTGLEIWMDLTETQFNSHADVIHQCPYRPWKTVTPFYNGKAG